MKLRNGLYAVDGENLVCLFDNDDVREIMECVHDVFRGGCKEGWLSDYGRRLYWKLKTVYDGELGKSPVEIFENEIEWGLCNRETEVGNVV